MIQCFGLRVLELTAGGLGLCGGDFEVMGRSGFYRSYIGFKRD